MPSQLQLALRNAIAQAVCAAAASDVNPETHEYCYSEILPRLAHDAIAGTLPDDPQDWFQRQLECELQNGGPKAPAMHDLLKRAAHLVAIARLGAADIASMLERAGAPEPENPADIVRLAADCLTEAMCHQSSIAIDAQWAPYQQILCEAREAHRTLRRLMPLLIDLWKGAGDSLRVFEYETFERELAKPDFGGPTVSIGIGRAIWGISARSLAGAYREIINPKAGWSRNGPAARFLAEALGRAFPGTHPTPAAIEMLLARRGPSRPIRGTQMILDKMRT